MTRSPPAIFAGGLSCLQARSRPCILPKSSPSRDPLMHFDSRRVLALLLLVMAGPAFGQPVVLTKEAYVAPPKEIADAVLATENENFTLTNISPDGAKFLITKNDGMPTLQRMARPCVYLGEMA